MRLRLAGWGAQEHPQQPQQRQQRQQRQHVQASAELIVALVVSTLEEWSPRHQPAHSAALPLESGRMLKLKLQLKL
jgi:hypothetical protein